MKILEHADKNKLEKQEELELIIQYQHGTLEQRKKALTTLLKKDMLFIKKVAKKYSRKRVESFTEEDHFGNGVVGYITALNRFDRTKGCTLKTYAGTWIRQAVTRTIHDKDAMIRKPVHLEQTMAKMGTRLEQVFKDCGTFNIRSINKELITEFGEDLMKEASLYYQSLSVNSIVVNPESDADMNVKATGVSENTLPSKTYQNPVDSIFYDQLKEKIEEIREHGDQDCKMALHYLSSDLSMNKIGELYGIKATSTVSKVINKGKIKLRKYLGGFYDCIN